MNILLWVLQIMLALLCISGGGYKIAKFDALKKGLASMKALPKGLWLALGAVEILGGIGLLIPGVAYIAAIVVALESIVISALYLSHGDKAPVGFTAVMAALAAVIAYGRMGA